jgi:hypothetical protein
MPKPSVNPGQLDFYGGQSNTEQVLGVTVAGEDVIISVPRAPQGSQFDWDYSPPAGWELRRRGPTAPPGGTVAAPAELLVTPYVVIRVRFKPSPTSTNEVQGTLQIDATKNDPARTPIPGFPVNVPLRGNVDGVGPGTLEIIDVNADPVGPDTPGEYVEIVNLSNSTVDLNGCRVGDIVFGVHGGERELLRFQNAFTLNPVSGAGARKRLRIFTGGGVPADPSFLQVPLNRGSPVWNNAGDTAWIKNSSGQLVDSFTYPTVAASGGGSGSPPSSTPGRTTSSIVSTVPVPPRTTFIPTGITVEEADILSFAAAGEVWIAWGPFQGSTGPAGRGTEPAPIGWPADAPPYSLIGRIGTTGSPFFIGSASTRVVRNDGGPLFLGINDILTDDNHGRGFTCVIIHTRTT